MFTLICYWPNINTFPATDRKRHATNFNASVTHCNKQINNKWWILDGKCEDIKAITCPFCKRVEEGNAKRKDL